MPYSPHESDYLIQLARRTIEYFLSVGKILEIDENEAGRISLRLVEKRACFVTLTEDFELRGCMGDLVAGQPLYQSVIVNAVAAAFKDDRFNPVAAAEIPNLDIEISVLTPPVALTFGSPDDLLSRLTVGVDGVTIVKENKSATFLPQVWDELLDKKEFLSALCLKADLAPDEWRRPGLSVQTYRVEIISSNRTIL